LISDENTNKQKTIEKVNKEKQDEWISLAFKSKKKGFEGRSKRKYSNLEK